MARFVFCNLDAAEIRMMSLHVRRKAAYMTVSLSLLWQSAFPLEFSMQSLPSEACVELVFDRFYEITERSWGSDHFHADIKSEAGLHTLSLAVHRRGKGRGAKSPLCSQVLLDFVARIE